jgi:prephenate dehydratase
VSRIGYLGPAGTFSEWAVREVIGEAPDELVPQPTVHRVVMAVAGGDVDRALAPIENSLEGSVNEAVDALVHDAPDVRIVGEHVLGVRYCLLAPAGTTLEDVRAVLSHPQALAQCARWLREWLPRADVLPRTSTAEAVREVAATRDGARAALGTALAGELYGASVLARDLGDDAANATRFVWLERRGAGPGADPASGSEGWKSSVVFSGDGDGSPGWLVRCLSEFAFRGVNLTRIESRPARRRLGHYVFLVDFEGRADVAGPVADALEALGRHCEDVRLVGAYPAAAGALG